MPTGIIYDGAGSGFGPSTSVFHQRVRATRTGQSIAALSTFLWQIPLNRADYAFGNATLWLPVSVANVNNRRNISRLSFSTALADAVAESTLTTVYAIATYPSGAVVNVVSPPLKGYSKSIDGFSSDGFFGAGVTDTLLRVKDHRINGSNLEITMENTHATLARTFTAELLADVWKVA